MMAVMFFRRAQPRRQPCARRKEFSSLHRLLDGGAQARDDRRLELLEARAQERALRHLHAARCARTVASTGAIGLPNATEMRRRCSRTCSVPEKPYSWIAASTTSVPTTPVTALALSCTWWWMKSSRWCVLSFSTSPASFSLARASSSIADAVTARASAARVAGVHLAQAQNDLVGA